LTAKVITPAPEDRLTADAIRRANSAGLRDANDDAAYECYWTPVLQVAYNLGKAGQSLQDAPVVSGLRFGRAPESGLSHNHREDVCEMGLSLAQEYGGSEIGSTMWFRERAAFEYRGIKVGTGSDGETLILPFHVENLD
jgi:hypothetical protein